MNNDSDTGRLDTSDPRVAAIFDLIPGLMYQQSRLRKAGFDPVAVVLPADMDPGKYEGDDATDTEARMLGMPIVWGHRVGLVLPA